MDMMMELIQQYKFVKLLNNNDKTINELVENLPKTFQSPTMGPYCKG